MDVATTSQPHTVSARRLTSPLLSGIAWHTSALTQYEDLGNWEGFESFKGFLAHLLKYESRVFSLSGCTRPIMDMQRLLGLGLGSNEHEIVAQALNLKNLSNQGWSRLCGLVCAYRLVDVIALLGGSQLNELKVPPRPLPLDRQLYGMSKLDHWPTLVTNFHKLMQKVAVPEENPFADESGSSTFRLLSLISKNEWSKSFANIEGNFLIAAMHISAMREFPFSQDAYPDLPERFESMVNPVSVGKRVSLSPSEKEDLRNLYCLTTNIANKLSNTKDGLPYLRAPLQLSLLISPLYLLIPAQLHKKSYSRQLMLSTSELLGNQKPDTIVAVEKAIWRVVFALADGRLNPTKLLKELSDELPWGRISELTPDARGWFAIQNDSSPKAVSISPAIPPDPAIESRQLDEDEFSSIPIMPSIPSVDIIDEATLTKYSLHCKTHGIGRQATDSVPNTLVQSQDEGTPAALSSSTTPHTRSPMASGSDLEMQPVSQLKNIFSPSVKQSLDTSIASARCESQTTGESDADEQLPMAPATTNTSNCEQGIGQLRPTEKITRISQDDVGIDPSLVFHEGQGDSQNLVAPDRPLQAGVTMGAEDQPASNGGSNGEVDQNPSPLLCPPDDVVMQVQSSVESEKGDVGLPKVTMDSEADEVEMQHASEADEMEIQPESSVISAEDIEMQDGEDQISERVNHEGSLPVMSKPNLRARDIPPRYQENRTTMPKKRKAANSDSDSNEDTNDSFAIALAEKLNGSFAPSLAETLRTNPNREPETLTEFTDIELISFTKDDIPARVVCDKELEAVDADGRRHTFRPQAHYIDYLDRLQQFFNRVEQGYVDGHPPHIANPDHSGFAILTVDQFREMSPNDVQDLFRHKNVVVTGCDHPDLKFDEAGLRTLAPLDSQVSIIDFTFPSLLKDQNSFPATVSGLVGDILHNARNPEGKILNGINFPACFPTWDNGKTSLSYATDVVAWDYLRGKPYCGNFTNPYPTAHMRWGLGGTANAVTFQHIDSDGYSTFVQVITGKKVWGILQESPEHQLSSTDFFLDEKFLLDEIDEESTFGLEAIVLRPGDMFFMQPGVPHFVFGLEDTICYGGHFYVTALMQNTLRSLVHSFVVGDFITNITHHPSRSLLRRIVLLYHIGLVEERFQSTDIEQAHVPDISTFSGVLDLLSACILAILGNVLDFRTYSAPNQKDDKPMTSTQTATMTTFDRNDIPHNERLAICYVRGVALFLFDWVRSQLLITAPDGLVLEDLPSRFLVQIIKSLVRYKAKAMRMKMKGAPHCDTSALKRQAANVVKCDSIIESLWKNPIGIPDDRLAIEGKDGYVVQKKEGGPNIKPLEPTELLRRGMSPFDIKFFQGQATGFAIVGDAAADEEGTQRSKRARQT